MKNLLKLLSPFAPDQSGAVSVLYELGGLIVICDAGGCAGNVCGFDEPRWFEKKSAVFSAGLRDMDAILGRDDKLVAKMADAVLKTNVKFTAIIGTPVPAVIATDYRAVKRLAEKKCNMPCIPVETTGTNNYDKGEETAFLELFKTFAVEKFEIANEKIGVIGATPLEISCTKADKLKKSIGENAVCYGMGTTLSDVAKASSVEKNIVIAPSGIKSAEYLKEKFGTPYEINYPCIPENILEKISDLNEKNVLVVHQQVCANTLREKILAINSCECVVGTWFMREKSLEKQGDLFFSDEENFVETVENGNFDVIIGDKLLKRTLKDFKGEYIDYPHFAVSGRLEEA